MLSELLAEMWPVAPDCTVREKDDFCKEMLENVPRVTFGGKGEVLTYVKGCQNGGARRLWPGRGEGRWRGALARGLWCPLPGWTPHLLAVGLAPWTKGFSLALKVALGANEAKTLLRWPAIDFHTCAPPRRLFQRMKEYSI